jgi:DNA polymerase III gamma/tau subunit
MSSDLWDTKIIDACFKQLSNQQSILIQGEASAGRNIFILNLVKQLICSSKTGCSRCNNCTLFNTKNHPDIFIIDHESKSIDKVRALIGFAQTKPSIGFIKIAVILDADQMNYASLNALLKTLEEPAASVKIILGAQTNLIPTILSRCYKFNLPESANKLNYIKEQTGCTDLEALSLLNLSANEPLTAINYFNNQTKNFIETIINCKDTKEWLTIFQATPAMELVKILQILILDLIKYKYNITDLAHYNSDKIISICTKTSLNNLYITADHLQIINKKLTLQNNLHQTACLNQLATLWFNI